MEEVYEAGKTFEKKDSLPRGEYENCIFKQCVFADLSGIKFVECEFHHCNLSLTKLSNTALRDVKFSDCKMLGLRFDSCTQFGFSINVYDSMLNNSSFYKVKMVKTKMKNVRMQEVDLSECDLTASVLDNCDFAGAIFDRTILEKADLRTSYNYSLDPATNRIKKAKFSIHGIPGLLDKYDILIEGI